MWISSLDQLSNNSLIAPSLGDSWQRFIISDRQMKHCRVLSQTRAHVLNRRLAWLVRTALLRGPMRKSSYLLCSRRKSIIRDWCAVIRYLHPPTRKASAPKPIKAAARAKRLVLHENADDVKNIQGVRRPQDPCIPDSVITGPLVYHLMTAHGGGLGATAITGAWCDVTLYLRTVWSA